VLEKLGRDEEAISAMERAHQIAVNARDLADPMVIQAEKNLRGLKAHVMRKRERATRRVAS